MTQTKHCYACKRDLPVASFGNRKTSPDGLSYECRECKRAYQQAHKPTAATLARKAAWTKANRARVNAQATAWYHRNRARVLAKDPHMNRIKSRIWAAANRERSRERARIWAEANPGKAKAWRKANPDKLRASHVKHGPTNRAARRAREKGANCNCCQTPDGKANMALVYAIGRKLGLHVDHVKPLARGGLHCLHNLQYLTPLDNMRKGAKWQEAA